VSASGERGGQVSKLDRRGKVGLEYDPELLEFLLNRYENENRPLRCSEPRDLIHRSLDICRYLNQPPGLSRDLLELAWINYFGKEKTANN
jgi:hypothetical protein